MLDTKVKISAGDKFEPLPMGVYTCQVSDVNLKQQAKFHSTEMEDVLVYQMSVLNEGKLPDGSDLRGRFVWKRCRLSINDRSWLGKLAKAVIGRDMTDVEIEAFDPESLVGQQVNCMVEQAPSKDGTQIFNNVIAFSPTKTKMEPITDTKGVSVAATTTTKSVVPEAVEEENEEVDAEIEALEAQAKVAAAKAAKAKAKK